MSRLLPSKEISGLVKAALRAGWTLQRTGKHPKLLSPDGKVRITLPSSPSCAESYRIILHKLRKAGLEV